MNKNVYANRKIFKERVRKNITMKTKQKGGIK